MFKWIKAKVVKVVIEVLERTEIEIDPVNKTGKIRFKKEL